jgi:GST-like protein
MNDEHVLYGAAGSGSAAVEAALLRCDLPYRVVEGATWEPGPGYEQLKRVNPLAQVPTLVLPDGTVLSESAAILIHLGLTQPRSGLLPAEPLARAQALRGLVFIAANCYALIGICDYPERYADVPDEAARKRSIAVARARLHLLWEHFADLAPVPTPFYGGARPGALDLLAAVVSRWSGARAHLQAARPACRAVIERVDADPQLAPLWARHWPPARST